MAKIIDENQVLNMVLNEGMKPLYVAKKLSVGARGRQQALKFMDFIYKDATIFLQRKYDKFKDIQRLVNAS